MRSRFAVLLILGLTSSAWAIAWPDDYVLHEGTSSPDGRFGIIVPAGESDDPNYLVDLKAHRVVGEIEGSAYFERENHCELSTVWNADSTLCVADYDGRFGFGALRFLQPLAKGFPQVDLGKRVQRDLDAVIAKQARDGYGL